MADSNVKGAGKLLIKEIIWRCLSRHSPSNKKNICLYASRRSGGTILMEVIASNKGITFSGQPFALYSASPSNLKLLPIFEYSQIISMDPEEEKMLRDYINGIFSGDIHANAPWQFWRYGGIIRSDRVLLKVTDAKSIVDWIDKNFRVNTVIMTRHPIPQALSVIRNQWMVTGKAFLRNRFFVENYLDDRQVTFCEDIYRNGSALRRHVTDWALENLIPIRLLPDRPNWKFVAYENLIMEPEDTIRQIAQALVLSDYDAMIRRLQQPSRTTRIESTQITRQKILEGDRKYLLYRWKSKVSNEDEKYAIKVLECLGIELYRYGDVMPNTVSVGR